MAFLSLITIGLTFFFSDFLSQILPERLVSLPILPRKVDFEKFRSEEDFITYLKAAPTTTWDIFGVTPQRWALERAEESLRAPGVALPEGEKAVPERVSETTVQVKGIDEPDIVKTDGKDIYFSGEPSLVEERGIPLNLGEVKIIKAFPLTGLAKEAEIETGGDLLLAKNILVIFTNDGQIYGYNVSNPKSPRKQWKIDLERNDSLVDARLYQGKIYFVTQTRINTNRPCPVAPLSLEGKEFSIKCMSIYHPTINVPIDTTYTAFVLEPTTGKIKESLSFVGLSETSVLYMSQNALYVTYSYFEEMVNFFYKFFLDEGRDLVSRSVTERLKLLQEYEISSQAKMAEFQNIFEQYLSSLDNDDGLRVENEFSNRMERYFREHPGELESTKIVKISLGDFEILASGSVPGRPLNQFSLDEYRSYLRIATTVGEGPFPTEETSNGIYVLDQKLQLAGSIVKLGLGERIYSARFIEDKGYLVTFRETDPFFVLDLSNPRQPKVEGELKIPGYSSYLHPISQDKILGIGKEGSEIKVSLFDVTSPSHPTEVSKYILDEYWSEILNTHHAFLLDKEHSVFFLPGSQGGYIFSYQGNQLRLRKAVADIQARRAIYINNYLYIIGDDRLVVLNETSWEEINQLEF